MSVTAKCNESKSLRVVCWLVLTLYVCGCTSMQPVEMPAEQLREKIAAGEVFTEGEKARIITEDEKEHRIRVREVSEGMVIGSDTQVPIEDIVAVETREVSAGRTTLLLGAAYVGVMYYVTMAVGAALILSSGGG